MFELYTARLLLRDLVADDWPAIYAMSQSPAVTQYQSWLRLADETEAREWVQRASYHNQLEPRQAYNLAVVQLEPREVIGWFGWGRPSDRSRGDYSFGYALLPSAWGHGSMSEALQAGLGSMFETLAATLVYGECASSNRASARVMEKAGMALVHQWDEADPATGATETFYRYAMQVAEWRQHRSQLSRTASD
jgi:[ribosomal protein S5]-alanine N-acetyltransferase